MDRAPIRILYVGKRPTDNLALPEDGFSLTTCTGPGGADTGRRPDIVIMDPFSGDRSAGLLAAEHWLNTFKALGFRSDPAYFIVSPQDAGRAACLDFMALGFDEVIQWPLSARALSLRSRVYLQKSGIQQDLFAKTASLDKAFGYLDRFKTELKRIKDELTEEKNSLNAALKQIQQMTAERRRIKAGAADLKDVLARNMEGVEQILHKLIRHRVEKNRGHGEAVARVAGFVAAKMGVGEKELEDISKAAMLHELGLLFLTDPAVADSFRAGETGNGPGSYDRALMMQFPAKGAELLRLCPGFEAAAQIIEKLNENSDGTGYPDGLKRRHIPMASRILAGADELVGLRDRGDVQGTRALLSGLEALAGSRLDPVVVGWLEKYVILHMGEENFRVRGVGIEQLEPGMTLGTALFTTTGTKLFTAGTVLTQAFIDKIIQYHREYPVDETVYIKV